MKSEREDIFLKGGDPAAGSPTATLLRLHPNHRPYRRRLPLLLVGSPASGKTDFRGVTGGVYKARERIHPSMLTSITSDSDFMQSSCRLQSGLGHVFWDWLHLTVSLPFVRAIVVRV